MKHTPGPWTLEMGVGSGRQIKAIIGKEPEARRNFVEFILRGDIPVAIFTDVWCQFPSQEWSEMQDANARLIAAAPDLLEALEEMMRVYPAGGSGTTEDRNNAVLKVEAAINKAQGDLKHKNRNV